MVALKCAIKKPSSSEVEVNGIRFVPCEELQKLGMDAIDGAVDEVVAGLYDLQKQITDREEQLRGIERFSIKNTTSRCIQIRLELGALINKRGKLQDYLEQVRVRYRELEQLELERMYQSKIS